MNRNKPLKAAALAGRQQGKVILRVDPTDVPPEHLAMFIACLSHAFTLGQKFLA